jgi:hypothetical protein
MASTSFPFYVKTISGDIIPMSYDPSNDSSLSIISNELSEKLYCHPSQIHFFHLSNQDDENKDSDSSFVPSPEELVGVFIKDPEITVFTSPGENYGEKYYHVRYIRYIFRVSVFETIYSKELFYCPSTNSIYPRSSFYVNSKTPRGFLPAVEKKFGDEFKVYHNFREFVEHIPKLPSYLYDRVTEMIEDHWCIIQLENQINKIIPSNGDVRIIPM